MFTYRIIEKWKYKLLFLTLIITGIFTKFYAQEDHLFIPNEIKQAYENNTRSYDGTPGENYWQNTVDYDMEVEVFPTSGELKGTAIITYYNNSPDPLDKIIMRVNHYANPYNKNGPDREEGMKISKMTYDGSIIDLKDDVRRGTTNMHVQLPKVIQPGTKANLEVEWSMAISQTTPKDSSSFFITNFFPEVAVYDDIFGWDEELPQELRAIQFYRNLGDYNVNISVPEAFTVVASGELQNAAEVLPAEQYDLYKKAKNSDEAVTIISGEDINNGYKHKSNTWNYLASEITEFAFGLSDHYAWNGAKVDVEDREVFVTTYYNVSHDEEPKEMINRQQQYIKYFSENMPGIPYPFPEFTSFIVGSGGATGAAMIERLWGTNMHNMLHQYFPRYVRINEKHFTWMDEGILDFNTTYLNRKFLQNNTQRSIIEGNGYQTIVGSVEDLPLIASSRYLDDTKNAQAPIKLTQFIFSMLYHELGHETFTKAYREFIRTWAKKSPTPYDLFNTFEKTSGQDLDWFWEPWFFRFGDVNVSISSLDKGELTIDNEGTRPVPVVVNVTYRDGSRWKTDLKASIWRDNDKIVTDIPDFENISNIEVNRELPDSDIFNNFYPVLKERFDEKIDNKIFGKYSINEAPFEASIKMKRDLLFMILKDPKKSTYHYFIPKSDNTFQSLKGGYTLTLEEDKDNNGIRLILSNDSWQGSLTGQKL